MGRFTCILFFSWIAIGLPLNSAAQEEDFPDLIHQNKLYKTGSSWFTIGGGVGYFPALNRQQRNFIVDINSRIKKHYFTVGFHYEGDNFITQRSGQRFFEFHGGYGWRAENLKRNLYAYIGPGYAFGYVFHHYHRMITDQQDYTLTYYNAFNGPSIYGEAHYVRKIFYDIGIGAGVYASANKNYQTVGVRLFIYLSTAYIDKVL